MILRRVHHRRPKPAEELSALKTCRHAPFAATAIIPLGGVHRRHASRAGHLSTRRQIAPDWTTRIRQVVQRLCGIRRRRLSRRRSSPGISGSRRHSRLAVSVSRQTRPGGIRRIRTSGGVTSAGIRIMSALIAHTAHATSAIRGSTQGGAAPSIAAVSQGQRVAARDLRIRAGETIAHLVVVPARRDPAGVPLWQHRR